MIYNNMSKKMVIRTLKNKNEILFFTKIIIRY